MGCFKYRKKFLHFIERPQQRVPEFRCVRRRGYPAGHDSRGTMRPTGATVNRSPEMMGVTRRGGGARKSAEPWPLRHHTEIRKEYHPASLYLMQIEEYDRTLRTKRRSCPCGGGCRAPCFERRCSAYSEDANERACRDSTGEVRVSRRISLLRRDSLRTELPPWYAN